MLFPENYNTYFLFHIETAFFELFDCLNNQFIVKY